MRRALGVLFAAGLAVIAIGGMAQAKPGFGEDVTETVAISGPGLSGPIGLDKATVSTYLDLSNVFDSGSRMHVRPSAVTLGPRFDLLLTMACNSASGLTSVHQDLYPYASFRGQPQVWTFTPGGQKTCSEFVTVAGGWNATRRGMFDSLVVSGLPRTAPVSASVSAPVQSPIAQPDRFWPLVWTIVGLMTLVLIGVVLGRPRRKRARVLG